MKWSVALSLLALLLSCVRSEVSSPYRPVVIVHGLFDGPAQFETLKGFIEEARPGTEVTILEKWSNLNSLKNLWSQEQSFRSDLEAVMNQAEDGIHLICFSQGGLVCRALLSEIPNHNVHNFIALSSPLAGQYGDTDYLTNFPHVNPSELYKWCYGIFGKHGIFANIHPSICDYWNDPSQHEKYLKHNDFLPRLNGEIEPNEEWRTNFLRIKKMCLIGGPDDGVITPWQSSCFGFYNSNKTVVEMKDQQFYKNDTFGLRELDERGGIEVCIQNGVKHTHWHQNQTVFDNCIKKCLD